MQTSTSTSTNMVFCHRKICSTNREEVLRSWTHELNKSVSAFIKENINFLVSTNDIKLNSYNAAYKIKNAIERSGTLGGFLNGEYEYCEMIIVGSVNGAIEHIKKTHIVGNRALAIEMPNMTIIGGWVNFFAFV